MSDAIWIAIIGAIAAAAPGFWDWLKTKRNKRTPAETMTMAIGRDRLVFLAKKHIAEGSIPEDEFEAFEAIGRSYLDMGGNSVAKRLYEDAMKLPLDSEAAKQNKIKG